MNWEALAISASLEDMLKALRDIDPIWGLPTIFNMVEYYHTHFLDCTSGMKIQPLT